MSSVTVLNETGANAIGSINPPNIDFNANEKVMLMSWLIVKEWTLFLLVLPSPPLLFLC